MDHMLEAITVHIEKSSSLEGPSKAKHLLKAGVYQRIVQQLEQSAETLTTAFNLFKESGSMDEAQITKLRLATTLAWQEKYTKSDDYYKKEIKRLEGAKDPKKQKLLAYALENLAKSKFRRNFYKEALDLFLEAHEVLMLIGRVEEMGKVNDYILKTRENLED
ncbi:MAG: hypothetical protein ACPGJV_00145 [Bacteriovoracaceae bacterium]